MAPTSPIDLSDLPSAADTPTPWVLYMLECEDGSFYTGITVDLRARYRAHLLGVGAKYTRSHKPLRVLAWAGFPDRSQASKAEWEIKHTPRIKKLAALREMARVHDEMGNYPDCAVPLSAIVRATGDEAKPLPAVRPPSPCVA